LRSVASPSGKLSVIAAVASGSSAAFSTTATGSGLSPLEQAATAKLATAPESKVNSPLLKCFDVALVLMGLLDGLAIGASSQRTATDWRAQTRTPPTER